MHHILAGALAGFVATLPMSAVMGILHRLLPPGQRYPLPPREITEEALEAAHIPLDHDSTTALTASAHLGYGAACGALYGSLGGRGGLGSGIACGLVVWTASYLGWLPALGLGPSATREPAPRNALMIAAHVVWGAALGAVAHELMRGAAAAHTGTARSHARPGGNSSPSRS
jgi:uncharacterized membrane protein YagU involved in acid resistance